MRVLHLSALPIWGQGEKSGMPSLYENLRHYALAGHRQTFVLPQTRMVPGGKRIGDPMPRNLVLDLPIELVQAPVGGMRPAVYVRSCLPKRLGNGRVGTLVEAAGANSAWMILTAGFIRTTLALARTRAFDVVYAHNDYSALAGYLVGRLLHIPNITRLYGTFLSRMMALVLLPLRYTVMCSPFLIPCNLLVVTNDGTRGDEVAERFRVSPERLRFWPNGVDLDGDEAGEASAPSLPFETGARLVVSLCRHVSWKRLDRVIRCIPFVRARVPDTKFVICGSGPLTSELQALAERLGVSDMTLWPGALSRGHVRQLLAQASVVISTNNLSNRCNPVIEAIYAGCPVVTLDDGTTADFLAHGENCLLVPADDNEALGRAVARVLSDAGLERKLRAGAREAAERSLWTWAQRMQAEISEVEAIVAARRAEAANARRNRLPGRSA